MKPTHYTPSQSKRSALAATICYFQPDNRHAHAGGVSIPANRRSVFNAADFLALSADFLNRETKRSFAVEATFFGILVAISAWPIVSMGVAIAKWIK